MINIETVILENAPSLHKKIKDSWYLPSRLVYITLKFILKEKALNNIFKKYALPTDKQNDFNQIITNIQNILKDSFNLKWQLMNTAQININNRHIFVANHSSGGIDGLIFLVAINQLFLEKKIKLKELKILANRVLSLITLLRPFILPVGVFTRTTHSELLAINEYLSKNNPLLTFPAGVVSRKLHGKLTEKDWSKNFILQAIEHQRNVVPTFIDIQNSKLFYTIAALREKLKIKLNIEMFLLPREIFKQKNKTIKIHFAPPITHQTLKEQLRNHTTTEITKKIQIYVLSKFTQPLFD